MKPWHEKPRTEWTPHDWLYAAAAELLKVSYDSDLGIFGPTRAAHVVMDFADANCREVAPTEEKHLR